MQACRVTYWTGWLSPEMEGCSKEVFALKDHFRRSRIVGVSAHDGFKASVRDRYMGIPVRAYPVLRLVAPMLELAGQVTHIYGSMAEWFLLRALGRRPIVLTVATTGAPLGRDLYRHVRRVVAHANTTVRDLIQWGFDPASVALIRPGIDLEVFCPLSEPARRAARRPFRILFATTPRSVPELGPRGVSLLLDTAARLPEVEFWFAWRPWGNAKSQVDAECRARGLLNVRIIAELVPDMRQLFHATDATIAPFTVAEPMKACPTSLVESLACGKPVLVSTHVAIADLVEEAGCGTIFEPNAEALVAAIEQLRSRYDVLARHARTAAERYFDRRDCLHQHELLYREVVMSSC